MWNKAMDQTCIQQNIQGENFWGFLWFFTNRKTFPINYDLLIDNISLEAC